MNNFQRITTSNLKIWGGLECTINRLGDNYLDQLNFSKFYDNPAYLDSILSLGITSLRFPVLWEKHEPVPGAEIDWSWAGEHLNKIRENGANPIVGLLHHGSGPSFTNLLDDNFPEKFAAYALKVATQFPWVKYYTPINEPLTTARFSGLYGYWYPHKTDEKSFLTILLNELKGIVMAMKAVRKINPDAQLIQTEDLSKTYCTPGLKKQAGFENCRRWLTFDILSGSFDTAHPLWPYFIRAGIAEKKLRWFQKHACKPDIAGVNYYLTSERFLDENINNYPNYSLSTNGKKNYIDIEAVRVPLAEPNGLSVLLKELWHRYKIPIAITEAHLHCSREEQMRWLKYIYNTAVKLTNENINIIAVTSWALLGSFGWNKLLTSLDGEYEVGAFDISAGYARPTAIATLIKQLATKGPVNHPVLSTPGWWQRDDRYVWQKKSPGNLTEFVNAAPVLIIGDNKMGHLYRSYCTSRAIKYAILTEEEFNIQKKDALLSTLTTFRPWAIIDCSKYNNAFRQKNDIGAWEDAEVKGLQNLAIACRNENIKLLSFSTATVFNNKKDGFQVEKDEPQYGPLSNNAQTLFEFILTYNNPSALIIRTGQLFGAPGQNTYIDSIIGKVFNGEKTNIQNDRPISFTYLPHLVDKSLDLLIDDAYGICHLVNESPVTYSEFAQEAINYAGADAALINFGNGESTLDIYENAGNITSEKYAGMPAIKTAMKDYFYHHSKKNYIHENT